MKQSSGSSAHHAILGLPAARITGAILGLFLCIMVGLIAGCTSKTKDEKGGGGDGSQTKAKTEGDTGGAKGSEANVPLTEDFFPMALGKERRKLLTRQYDLKTNDGKYKENRGAIALSEDTGLIISNNLDPSTRSFVILVDGKGGHGLTSHRKTASGIDTLISLSPPTWKEFLKFGATPGDKWGEASTDTPQHKLLCKYVRCEMHDGLPCAVVTDIQGGTTPSKRRWFLLKGVGVVRVDMYYARKEQKGAWFPVVQHICDDWQGDKSPLVVENPTK